jgi:hypothetical protein
MRRDPEAQRTIEELLEEVRGLRAELRKVKSAEAEHREQLGLVEESTELRKKIVDLEIKKDRLVEEHEREKREVKHMVGLERKRQEFEIDQAKRETTVTVREENLTADRKRFEEQMQFIQSRFEGEVGYLKGLMESILGRLPTVTVDRTIESIQEARARKATP